MGGVEKQKCAKGTRKICKEVYRKTKKDAFTLVGGGDSASAAIKIGFENGFTHNSTGGGASLAYLEGPSLPGIDAVSNVPDIKPIKVEKENKKKDSKPPSKKTASAKAKPIAKKAAPAKAKSIAKKAAPAKAKTATKKPVAKKGKK